MRLAYYYLESFLIRPGSSMYRKFFPIGVLRSWQLLGYYFVVLKPSRWHREIANGCNGCFCKLVNNV